MKIMLTLCLFLIVNLFLLPTFSGVTSPDNAPFWFGSAADYHKFTNNVSIALFFFTILLHG